MRHFFEKWKRPISLVLAFVMVFALASPVMVVNGAEPERVLHVHDRANSWDAVDILRDGMEIGDVITVTGRADGIPPVGTQMVLGGSSTPYNWASNTGLSEANQSFTLQLTLQENHIEEEQFVRFRIQTNGDGASLSFFIYEIEHTRDGEVIYSLSTDAYIQGAVGETNLNGTPALQISGGPAITVTAPQEPQVPVNILRLTNRTADWHSLEIHRTLLELGDVVEVTGRVYGLPQADTTMILGGAENPWNWANNTGVSEANQEFVLRVTLGENHMEEEQFVRFRIQTNGPGAAMNFFIDDIVITRDGDVVYALSADEYVQGGLGNVTTFAGHDFLEVAGPTTVTIVAEGTEGVVTLPEEIDPADLGPLENVHLVDFSPSNWDTYEEFITVGDQMEFTIVTDHGLDDNYAIRLENVTGNYTSGDGNFLQFNLPEAMPIGSTVEISWYVYVPSADNPGDRDIVGPGININGQFGSAPHQPTNTQPAPGDLARRTPMDEWFNTTVEFTLGPDVGAIEFLIFRFRVNDNETQPSVLYIDNISISTRGVGEVFIPEWDLGLPSLAAVFADYFMVGNIWSNNIQMNIGNTQEGFLHHFNAVTAENHHKPDFIASAGPDPATWSFETQDLIVDFAEANNLAMVGHTLIWHSQSPTWLTNVPGTTEPLTRAEAMANMHLYISTVAGRYAGRMQAWDVLNEAFSSSVGAFSGDWRNHLRTHDQLADNHPRWYEAFANEAAEGETGYDYIFYAFYFARQYDPFATLFYNDYNEEQPGKRDAIAQMVEYMNERWSNHPSYDGRLLIEGIGLQSHHHLDQWATNFDNIRPAIERFAQTGAVLAITELDITVGTQASPSIPLLPEQEARQAEYFARVFGYFVEFADYIERVTFWGKADAQSWRAWGSPVIFDGNFEAKDSFFAILDTIIPTPPVSMAVLSLHIGMLFDTALGFEDLITGESFSHFMDVPSQVVDGQVYVPLRATVLALGGEEPVWDDATREVVVVNLDGATATITPLIVNDRSMVSVGFIAAFFGAYYHISSDGVEIWK